jgi:hypothetical protein
MKISPPFLHSHKLVEDISFTLLLVFMNITPFKEHACLKEYAYTFTDIDRFAYQYLIPILTTASGVIKFSRIFFRNSNF